AFEFQPCGHRTASAREEQALLSVNGCGIGKAGRELLQLRFSAIERALRQKSANVEQLGRAITRLVRQRFGGKTNRSLRPALPELQLPQRNFRVSCSRVDTKDFLERRDRGIRLATKRLSAAEHKEGGRGFGVTLHSHVRARQRFIGLAVREQQRR